MLDDKLLRGRSACASLLRRTHWACPEGRSPAVGCDYPVVLQQQNFKQKVVALLRRFKVSEEVRAACGPHAPFPPARCRPGFSQSWPRPTPRLCTPGAPPTEQAVVPTPRDTPGDHLPCFLNITWMNTQEEGCTSSCGERGFSRGFCVFFYKSTFYSSFRFTVTSCGKWTLCMSLTFTQPPHYQHTMCF